MQDNECLSVIHEQFVVHMNSFKSLYSISQSPRLSENSDSPLAPKLLFGSVLANETPFHILFVAPVNFTPDASTLKRGLFE